MHHCHPFDSISAGAATGPEQDTMSPAASPSIEPLLVTANDSLVNAPEASVMVVS